jgi:P-type E1-E2 ATPase
MPSDTNRIEIEDLCGLSFEGAVVIQDPLREQVPDAIKQCHQAGIRVIMMTGDHKSTARSIGYTL